MLSRVTAKNVGDAFLRHSVEWIKSFVLHMPAYKSRGIALAEF